MDIKHNINIMYKMLLYDLLYFVADLLIKLRNPCEIHYEGIPSHPVCIKDGPCCGGCKYLGNDGCTVKCLGCKLGLCSKASDRHPKLEHFLIHMKAIARGQHSQTILYYVLDIPEKRRIKI